MVRRSSKQTVSKQRFYSFSGGLNLSESPEHIADNELQVCVNFIYDFNSRKLIGRGGLSKPMARLPRQIREVSYDVDTNLLLVFLDDNQAYSMIMNNVDSLKNIGVLEGNLVPSVCKFQHKLWIASGGKLQYYDFSKDGILKVALDSPICDLVFMRFARLAVMSGDNCHFSSIGDGAQWDDNVNDASSGKFLEIGYGDSGRTIAVVPLTTDCFFFKDNGNVYQLSGMNDYNSWQVQMIATGTDIVGDDAAVNIGNQIVFVSKRGMKTVQATMDYGNIATNDIGDKFNALVTKSLCNPRMFNLRRHGMLLIRPNSDWSYFIVYNYLLGAATEIRFGMDIHSMVETDDEIIVASGDSLYIWDVDYTTDNGTPIHYELSPKTIIGSDKVLLTSIDTKLSSAVGGNVVLSDGGRLNVQIPVNDRYKVRCNHSTDILRLTISGNKRFTIDHIILDIADL